jgi:hypothetical protein
MPIFVGLGSGNGHADVAASGSSPRFSANALSMMMQADEPSLSWLAFPAVM